MGGKIIVMDTHVFLRALSEQGAKSHEAYEHIKTQCNSLAFNNNILDEYERIANRHGLTSIFITLAWEDLKQRGKARGTAKFAGKKAIEVGPKQDRPFIECAIAAKCNYVITRDSDFDNFRDIAQEHHFQIVTPEEYLKKEQG